MTNTYENADPFFDNFPEFDAAEKYGEGALAICCRCEMETETLGIDLERHTYDALLVLVQGGTLDEAVACLNPRHPFSDRVAVELGHVSQRLADERHAA